MDNERSRLLLKHIQGNIYDEEDSDDETDNDDEDEDDKDDDSKIELGIMVVVKTRKANLPPHAKAVNPHFYKMYDVHDGLQRLCTIELAYMAHRHVLQEFFDNHVKMTQVDYNKIKELLEDELPRAVAPGITVKEKAREQQRTTMVRVPRTVFQHRQRSEPIWTNFVVYQQRFLLKHRQQLRRKSSHALPNGPIRDHHARFFT